MTQPAPYIYSSLLTLALSLSLFGCSPTSTSEPAPTLDHHLSWDEDDENGNNHAGDAEEVDASWQRSITINGTLQTCGYEGGEDWPWTGDNDNYRVEVPEDGYMDVELQWDSSSDLDLMLYFEPPGNNASPDWFSNQSDNEGPESYLFDEPMSRGDDIVVGVACAGGEADSYRLVVNWET